MRSIGLGKFINDVFKWVAKLWPAGDSSSPTPGCLAVSEKGRSNNKRCQFEPSDRATEVKDRSSENEIDFGPKEPSQKEESGNGHPNTLASPTDRSCSTQVQQNISNDQPNDSGKGNNDLATKSAESERTVCPESRTPPPANGADTRQEETGASQPPSLKDAESPSGDGRSSCVGNPSEAMSKGEEKRAATPKQPREITSRRIGYPEGLEKTAQRRGARSELICRSVCGEKWAVALCFEDKKRLNSIIQNNTQLDIETDGEIPLPTLDSPLSITYDSDDRIEIPLHHNKRPLIFKFRKNWKGIGRNVKGINKGHYIVIAPCGWIRNGNAPRERELCEDPNFFAHFFYCDKITSKKKIGGFRECGDLSLGQIIELVGERIFDDADNGDLFVGEIPQWNISQNIATIRIGEEGRHGWGGSNFDPKKQSFSEMMNGREGWFFIRAYDQNAKLIDSDEFRYIRDLKELLVDGKPYTETSIILPSKKGYQTTEIRLVHRNGTNIQPLVQNISSFKISEDDSLVLAPDPDLQRLTLQPGSVSVNISLDLPRIWYRLEHDNGNIEHWQDAPKKLTRKKFRKMASSGTKIRLRVPRRIRKIGVGFNDEMKRFYSHFKKDLEIIIPLREFADYSQLTQLQKSETFFNIQCYDHIVNLFEIEKDAIPSIASFSCRPGVICVGDKAKLQWRTENAGTGDVTIDQGIGAVRSIGEVDVKPNKTTTYIMTLRVSGIEVQVEEATVSVMPVPVGNKLRIAWVQGGNRRWRAGKGISVAELNASNLTQSNSEALQIVIDRRRKTVHDANVQKLRSLTDV